MTDNSEILPVHTVGCASGFIQKGKEGLVPVQQKLRLPLSVRQAVSDRLKNLLEQDIIEWVDASPWVSPVVVTHGEHAPAPHDMASLRSFLCLTSWYSKFLPDYATVVEPLREVLRTSTDMNFLWTDKAEQSFATLKTLLSKSHILALFDPRLPTYASTDTSDYCVGGVLSQLHTDDTERTVAFTSQILSLAERMHSTVEGEALTCVCGLLKNGLRISGGGISSVH